MSVLVLVLVLVVVLVLVQVQVELVIVCFAVRNSTCTRTFILAYLIFMFMCVTCGHCVRAPVCGEG